MAANLSLNNDRKWKSVTPIEIGTSGKGKDFESGLERDPIPLGLDREALDRLGELVLVVSGYGNSWAESIRASVVVVVAGA
jgi:hypothetical protein